MGKVSQKEAKAHRAWELSQNKQDRTVAGTIFFAALLLIVCAIFSSLLGAIALIVIALVFIGTGITILVPRPITPIEFNQKVRNGK